MVKKNDVIEEKVVDFALPESSGVIKQGGLVIFVPGALPGEKCQVKIRKIKRNYALGELVSTDCSSPFRIEPFCPHFGEGCGGCSLQYIDYPFQREIKEKNAREVLSRVGQVDWEKVDYQGMLPSPRFLEYRNKMEFNFGQRGEELSLGLRPRGRFWDLIDLKTCFLMKKSLTEEVLDFFRFYGRKHHLSGYDPVSKKGFLRNLLVRYSETQDQLLLGLSTTSGELPHIEELTRQLKKQFTNLIGFSQIINNSPASALLFEQKKLWYGEDHFFEKIGSISYRVSLESFFQVNTAGCSTLYSQAKELACIQPDETVLDLYCGSGGVGLFLADQANRIIGVEDNQRAIEDARFNAWANGLDNFTVIQGRVEKMINDLSDLRADVVVVDPPRAGLDKKLVRRISRIGAGRIVYLSCNVGTLARDISFFKEKGYHLTRLVFIDLFPQTPHFESVALLEEERL